MYGNLDDTICAIASAPGGAARGIVRISGASAVEIAGRMMRPESGPTIERLRHATALRGWIRLPRAMAPCTPEHRQTPIAIDPELRAPCDAFVWPTSRSYTREPVVELHTVGSPPILEAIVAELCRAGARLAEPGEFTLRAFLAGRIDLTQAEAVLGVIDAQHADELAASLAQLAGGLAKPLQALREDLLQLLAELEAGLDFADEDIQFVSHDELAARLRAARELVDHAARQLAERQVAPIVRQIALVGPPNAGKSSLFNALVERHGVQPGTARPLTKAIVSPRRGTTRDYLTATLDLHGVHCVLIDTAGVGTLEFGRAATSADVPTAEDDATDDVTRSAAQLAMRTRNEATLRVLCQEAAEYPAPTAAAHEHHLRREDCHLLALTKADRLTQTHSLPHGAGAPCVLTSSLAGTGINRLCETLRTLLLRSEAGCQGSAVASTAARCHESINLAAAALESAFSLALGNGGAELIAAEIRASLQGLGKVVGAVYTDDVLDRIFSAFCIGK